MHTENDNAIVILSDASNLGDSIAITLKKISIRTHVLNLDSIEQIDDSFDRVDAIIIPIDPRSHYQLVRTIILTTLQKNIPLAIGHVELIFWISLPVLEQKIHL